MNGYLPIPYSEIAAWSALTGDRLWSWEVASVRAMDMRFINGPPPEPVDPRQPSKLMQSLKALAKENKESNRG